MEASAAYTRGPVHASVAYFGSWFRNGDSSLTWSNPFLSGSAGATRGQLALAPDNEFNQVSASGAYDLGPLLRISGDVAWGQMTQDAALLAASMNPALVATLPAASLSGRVNTFNANARGSTQITDDVRLTATYSRDARDNRTRSQAWSASTATALSGTERSLAPLPHTVAVAWPRRRSVTSSPHSSLTRTPLPYITSSTASSR